MQAMSSSELIYTCFIALLKYSSFFLLKESASITEHPLLFSHLHRNRIPQDLLFNFQLSQAMKLDRHNTKLSCEGSKAKLLKVQLR